MLLIIGIPKQSSMTNESQEEKMKETTEPKVMESALVAFENKLKVVHKRDEIDGK